MVDLPAVLAPGDTLLTEVWVSEPGRYRVGVPAGEHTTDFVGLSNEFVVRDSDGRF